MFQPGVSPEGASQVSAEQRKDRLTAERLRRELRGERYVDLSQDTQFSGSWVWLGIILTIVGLALGSSFLLATTAALWVIAGASWAWNRLSLAGLHYERHLSETRAFLGEKIELTLTVRNRKPLPLTWLEITDAFPSALPFDGGEVVLNQASNISEFPTFWTVGAWQRLTRRYTLGCAQRGYHSFGPATLATGDGFGLFSRRATLPAQQRLIIYPRLYTVAELGLPAKNPFGERAAHDRLFEDPLRTVGIRDWQPADSLRRVHWKATARRQPLGGPMLSRLYEPSSEPQIVIFLNVATMPRHWQGNIPELLERAISVAGSLAAICAERRLPIGLVANGFLPGSDQPLRLLPGRSPNQLVRILELLAAITSFATGPIEELLLHEAPRLPWGATLLVVTAIAHEGLLAALSELAEAGRPVVLFTLAEEAPAQEMAGVLVYHLPHLADDLIAPEAQS